jgi:hypothetical protein
VSKIFNWVINILLIVFLSVCLGILIMQSIFMFKWWALLVLPNGFICFVAFFVTGMKMRDWVDNLIERRSRI